MKHIQRAVAVLALASLAATSACTVEKGDKGDAASTQTCGTGKDFLIGMSQANNAEPYRERMNDDIRTAAEQVPQFEVKFADAAQDNAKQVSDVENFLTQQIDLLIISPNEAAPLTGVVKKAYDAKKSVPPA